MTKYSIDDLRASSGVAAYLRALEIIPGGTQLLSKRPELFAPGVWPAYYKRAKGCRVWDLDEREFIDMSIMSVGACTIGYADDEIDESVIRAVRSGVTSSLNCSEEVELAELLREIHPEMEMVRYARSGGEAMGMAIRIARAKTRRDKVLFSGYHGWNDWYISANLSDNAALDGQLMPGLEPNGVPRGLSGTAIAFTPEDKKDLEECIGRLKGDLAAIVIEPARGAEQSEDYLAFLKEMAKSCGAVLIFDEITSGFRMCNGAIYRRYGINPDIAVIAKGMANGYAMSAVMGTREVMIAAEETFISSTNWTERVGPAAALATIKKYRRDEVSLVLIERGNMVKRIWKDCAQKNGLEIEITGLPSLAAFSFKEDADKKKSTFFTVEMLKRGFLAFRQFKPSQSHSLEDIAEYSVAVDKIFAEMKGIDFTKSDMGYELQQQGFKRLTRE